MFKNKYILSICLIFASVFAAKSQTYVFAQLQGSPTMVTTGWNLTGAANVGDTPGDADTFSDELILTNPTNTSSGGIFWGQSLNLTQCQKWTAEYEFRMFDGNGADGIAFCFIDVPPTGFVTGGGVGIPATANGLKIVFDTYENVSGTEANPEIQIRYGVGYHQSNAPFGTQPTVHNVNGSLNFLRSNEYQTAKVVYNNGNIDVYVNGTLYLSGFYLINFTGYLGFTSSTGAFNDRNSIRNVVIYTEEQAISEAGPATASYCSDGSVQVGTANNPNYTYSWSPATGLNQTNVSNPTVSLVNTGSVPITQIYTVTTNLVSNPGVCPTTDNITITINPTPTSSFTVSTTQACMGVPVTVTYTGNMNGAATFNWNFNGGTVVSGSGIGPYQISWPTDGAKQISLSVSKYGCTSTISTNSLTVSPTPTNTFTPPTQLCTDVVSSITYTGTGTVAATFNWNFDGANIVSGTNAGPYQLSWPTPGLKNITLTVTENGCVSAQRQDTVRVYGYPVPAFDLPSIACLQDSIAIPNKGTTTPPPGQTASYFWTWSAGSVHPDPADPSNSFLWFLNSTGTSTIGFQITEHGCASDTLFKTITVSPIPTATFTMPTDACTGEDVALTYTGTGSTTATYNWQYAPATLISGTGQGPLTIDYATANTYNVSLTVTENNCVSPTETLPIQIHAIPTSTFNLASGICVGQTAPLTYTGTGSSTAIFNWNFDGVEQVSGNGIGPYVLGDANLGTFNISLQVTENNCVSPITTKEFLVLPTPAVDFSGTPLIGCNPLPVQFTNLTPTQPGIVYSWNFGNGNASADENPLHIYNDAGNFTVSLLATNGFGCTATKTKPAYVKVTAQPVAGFGITPEKVTMDDPNIHVVDNSLFAETWTYFFGDGTTSTGNASPYHHYILEGDYEVVQIVTNSLGCTDKASIVVSVLPNTNVFIPNTFTPNEDGVNDLWEPSISFIKNFELRIYDRWGSLVFETDDLFRYWNGNYFTYGKAMPIGVYTYKIKFQEMSGKTQELLGRVSLVK